MNSVSSVFKHTIPHRAAFRISIAGSFLCAALSLTASAQTIFVPGGSVGTSSNGNVGIGTANPSQLLELSGSGSVYQKIGSKNSFDAAIHFSSAGSDAYIGRLPASGGGSGTLDFYNGGLRMVISPSGNVGIGTSSPQAGLDIWRSYSASTDSLRFSFNDGSAYWMGIQPYVVGAGNVGYRFRTNNVNTTVDALAITGEGKVGIGTTTPGHLLDVADRIRLRAGASGTAGIWLFNGTEDVGFVGDALYGMIGLWGNTGAGWGMLMNTTTGNVGIGTSTPSHKLAVNGTIRAKEVIVDTGWADYVFTEDYRLAPLAEVEAHIREKGHLPGIPSAAEVAEHGVSLGDMQRLLLEKIEELTLHQIHQAKDIANLKEENVRLRQQLSGTNRNP